MLADSDLQYRTTKRNHTGVSKNLQHLIWTPNNRVPHIRTPRKNAQLLETPALERARSGHHWGAGLGADSCFSCSPHWGGGFLPQGTEPPQGALRKRRCRGASNRQARIHSPKAIPHIQRGSYSLGTWWGFHHKPTRTINYNSYLHEPWQKLLM